MTPREKLQMAYELAFHPARLNAVWNEWEQQRISDLSELRAVVEWALMLHQQLPEAPAVSGRALRRLARYQATARLYRLPSMLRRFRQKLGSVGEIPQEVPAWMVRDVGLPVFGRGPKEFQSHPHPEHAGSSAGCGGTSSPGAKHPGL
jgi:hypothetical protein